MTMTSDPTPAAKKKLGLKERYALMTRGLER